MTIEKFFENYYYAQGHAGSYLIAAAGKTHREALDKAFSQIYRLLGGELIK